MRIQRTQSRFVEFIDARLGDIVDGADLVRPHWARQLDEVCETDELTIDEVARRCCTSRPPAPAATGITEPNRDVIAELFVAIGECEDEVDELVVERIVENVIAELVVEAVEVIDALDDANR